MAANNDIAKTITFFDTNLFSGSAELFRTAIGTYWSIGSSSTEGEYFQFAEDQSTPPLSTFVSRWDTNTSVWTEAPMSKEALAPVYTYAVRVVGTPENISNDKAWKAIVLGGSYGDNTYMGLFKEGTYDSTMFQVYLPYSKQEAKLLRGSDFSNTEPQQQIEIAYDYQYYVEEYENRVASVDYETLIPNMYFFEIFKGQQTNLQNGLDFNVDPLITSFADFATLTAEDLSQLYDSVDTAILPPFQVTVGDLTTDQNTGAYTGQYKDKTQKMRDYLGSTYAFNTVTVGVDSLIPIRLSNILFDDIVFEADAGGMPTQGGKLMENMAKDTSLFPYYVKINFPVDYTSQLPAHPNSSLGSLKDSIVENGFSQKFIKTLKETFLEETEDIPIETIDTVRGAEFNSADWSATAGAQIIENTTAATTTIKAIDWTEMLTTCYNNYNSETANCYFMGEETAAREAVMSTDSSHRYANTINTLGVLEYTDTILREAVYNDVEELLEAASTTLATDSTGTKQVGVETLAYRIEKLGGGPIGDGFTQGTLQNYWFFNAPRKGHTDLQFYDSQVKYGEDYTYVVYAYVAVVGQKYEYSDLKLTRQIGTADTTGDGAADQNCLEFYNPATDEVADQLYESTTLQTTYATNAQYIGTDSYLADFYVTYTPTIKIVEVPIFTKTLKVLDNPGSRLDVIPYQLLDDSQSIGFVLNYEFFVQNVFPGVLTAEDAQLKADYESANDFIPGEQITLDSVSRARYIEVYRLDTKPKQVLDFADNIYQRIDLKIANTKATKNIANVVDKIRTNTKYYYLFRALNEHHMPSHMSEIYEAELVNDGGYKYATFNTLFEEDLEEETFTEPSKFFKKLMHLKPNASQLLFDTSNVDFGNTAASEVSNVSVGDAEDPIWDKTFKIRLTSKKTGKKIDLNITYNLENQ
jgi:hypothetical protein